MKKRAIITCCLVFALLFSACKSSGANFNGANIDTAKQESAGNQPDDDGFRMESSPEAETIIIYPDTSLGDLSPSLILDNTVTVEGKYIIYGPFTFTLTARIIDGQYTYCLRLCDYEGDAEIVEIPAEVSGCKVVEIGGFSGNFAIFQDNLSLKKVVIPDTVEYIRSEVFSGCESLEEVIFHGGVLEIGRSAFEDCVSLKSIQIPDSVISIDSNAFYNCASLESINIPDSVTSIGSFAFNDCVSLQELSLPASVNRIGGFAFSDCPGLKELRITPEMRLDEDALYFCEELATVIIEDGVESLPNFNCCFALTELYIPDSVTSIGSFSGCNSLTYVRLSGGAEEYTADEYGNSLFEGSAVTFVDVGEGVKKLGSYVFGNDTLESIILPSTLTEIEENIFCYYYESESDGGEVIPISLQEVFFRGTEEQCLQELKDQVEEVGATIYYLSETEPTEEGNFWRYVDGKPVIW